MQPDVVQSFDTGLLQPQLRVGNEIAHQAVEDALERFIELQLVGRIGISLFNLAKVSIEDRNALADLFERQQMRFVAVIQVGSVVADFIG